MNPFFKKLWPTALVVLSFLVQSNGQPAFINIDESKGLSNLQITDLFQDSHGFVWIGTPHGLNRFDGYSCIQYLNLPGDTASISSNHISPHAFVEDADHNLWVATYRGGLNWFNRKTEQFTRYRAQKKRPNSISMDKIFAIEPDGKGGLWVATSGRGINHFDPKTQKFRVWNDDDQHPDLLMGSTMTGCLKQAQDGWLWIGTNKGACRFDLATERFEYFPFVPGLDHGLSDWFVTTIIQDRQGTLWLGTARGLNRWDPKTGKFLHYFFAQAFPEKEAGYDYILDLLEDDDGRLWLGTVGGLIWFNPANGTFERMLHTPDDPFSIQKGPVNTIMKDRQGSIWFGTNQGISILNTTGRRLNHVRFLAIQSDFKKITQAEGINAISEIGGACWLATQLGIFRHPYGKPLQRILAGNFNALFYDVKNELVYAGTSGDGFYMLDAKNFTEIRHVQKNEIGDSDNPYVVKGHRINSFAKDHQGYIWIASDGSLNRYDPVSGRIQKFGDDKKNNPNPSCNANHSLLIDQKGNLWIASMGGLSKLTKAELSKPFEAPNLHFNHFFHQNGRQNSISSDVVFCLLEGTDGTIWAGTDAGLNYYNPKTNTWQWFFKEDGLPDNEIIALVEDQNGNIWVATPNDGLAKYDRANGHFFCFSKKDGFHTEQFRLNAAQCTPEGLIILGGRSGMVGFHPDSLFQHNPQAPALYFTDFRIFNNPVFIGKGRNQLKTTICETNDIELDYNQNILSFQFAALNFINPEKQIYRYRLVPFQSSWQYNRNDREATFTNLDPGVYQLQVETSVNGYEWSGTSLRLRILPPWYRTWWAYLLYLLAAGGILYALRRHELRRQLAKSEAIHFKALDQAKTRLYTNITHEFRTPLTVILGMEEQVRKDPGTWHDEGLRLIRRNGAQLLRLVNQMLDLSKLESGNLPLRPVLGDVVSYLNYLTESFHSYAESKDIRLHFLSEVEALSMDYDPEKLQQIVSNLLSNAIKFTPAGGDVYLQLAASNASCHIRLKDTGIGIPAEKLPHIFDRFYQVEDSYTRSQEGSGIGLALVRELVRLMGGTIEVKSKPGEGSEFSILLPVTQHAIPAAATPPAALPDISDTLQPQQTYAGEKVPVEPGDRNTVLLVEDNPDVITYLSSVLTPYYRIETAKNGQEGIDKAIQHIPDLIVSDVMMPEKDGFELCQTLKTDERTSHIPIVLLTAKADHPSKIEGLSQGADAYLAKPFNQEELLVRLEKMIELRRRLQTRFNHPGHPHQVLQTKGQSLDDLFLEKVIRIIERQMADEDFDMPQLCKTLNMSRFNLFRKLKALTGQSATTFIRSMRLEKAKELLETTDLSVSEVCYAVGFNSPNYFSRIFQEAFGMAPSAVRKG